jgi:predicted transcriptional regulator of viral defense system
MRPAPQPRLAQPVSVDPEPDSAPDAGKAERLLAAVGRLGVVRPRDLAPLGIQPEYLRRLCDRGLLRKVGRGSYVLAGTRVDPGLKLALVARAVPQGVIGLESALAVHGLGRFPAVVDLVIDSRAATPRLDTPRLRVWRLSGAAFSAGVLSVAFGPVAVPVYGLEKTLADVFKFRNKIGPHVAVDALRAALRSGRVDRERLIAHARLDRVERVLRPFLEALAPAA